MARSKCSEWLEDAESQAPNFHFSTWDFAEIISAPKAFGSQSAEPLPAFGLPRRWSLWAFPRHSGSDRKSRGTGVFEPSKFRVFHSTFSVVRGDENISIHHTSFSTTRSIELNPVIRPAGEVCRGDLPWASPVPTAQCVGFGSCRARPSIGCCTCTGTLAWCLTVGLENVEETEPITSWKHFSICLGVAIILLSYIVWTIFAEEHDHIMHPTRDWLQFLAEYPNLAMRRLNP